MAKKQQKPAAIPNVVAGCTVRIMDISGTMPKWVELGRGMYTPLEIAKIMKKSKVTSAYVFFLGYKEQWSLEKGARLAKQVKR